ncbi:zinc-binding dehydrogenase [Cryptosporangium phraense]|uniref:Zinc-binding dehydrogenase n=1 Tax=Cryptosporangium phraense TaxID=2593070 RepID=A0A545AZU0_9ACTN|nr:alcohol dehydrogenase catalytic domain-containing protein [Cryptosporangium phraense]TQS46851.1 zinc-binding dehydrogenase [Cryptosporangium phraense]
MRAAVFEQFGGPISIATVPDPTPAPHGVVVAVEATGVCRSDWHGWQGHDDDVSVPHVPGHELAGRIVAVGSSVVSWRVGDAVTTPFVMACGSCPECSAGAQQVCRRQTQPGFTGWGSFAEFVALDHADVNLVALDGLDPASAAALGCRVATAFRAVLDVGAVRAGEFVAVHGCGGVGLSAVAIAVAAGAQVIVTDPSPDARQLALAFGASQALDPADAAAIPDLTDGGAHVSLDAVGHPAACEASIRGLRRRGRHVQVGLLPPAGGRPAVPMDRVIAYELQVLGSHGLAAHEYPRLLRLVRTPSFPLDRLVTRRLPLDAAPQALADVPAAGTAGITVLEP